MGELFCGSVAQSLVNPALVVGPLVGPLGLELVLPGPHEVSLDVLVEDVQHAVTEGLNLVVGVTSGVSGALAATDGGEVVGAEGTERAGLGAVEVDVVGLGHVGVGAVNPFARIAVGGVVVVETSQPEGADIGGERPLSNPHVVLDLLGSGHEGTIAVAVLSDVGLPSPPGEVLMSVHDNVLVVVILEEIVPEVGAEVEGIVEDEQEVGVHVADVLSHGSVEVLEDIHVGVPPRLVDGLDGVHSGVVSPSLEEEIDGLDGELDVLVVDVLVSIFVVVPGTHPLTEGGSPVLEVVLILPVGDVGETGVVKSVLGSSDGVDVEENLKVVLGGHVEEPLDGFVSTISAADVGSVLTEGPVTDGKSEDLEVSLLHINEILLGVEGSPMSSEDSITLLGSESLAKSPLVHTNTLRVGLLEEAVEEGRGDPGLEDLPSTNVGSDDSPGVGSGSKSRSGESSHISSSY